MATYSLKVSIDGTNPLVWRKIVVPDHITFHQLHLVIQECFQWKNYHLYEFEIPGVEEPITRFYSDFDAEERDGSDGREILIDPYMEEGARFRYVYDLGDWWEHVIDVLEVDPLGSARMPYVTAFQGESLIEDAGGVDGYYETMRILDDPEDPEYRETREWVKWQAPGAFSMDDANDLMEETLYFPKAAYTAAVVAARGPANQVRIKLQDVVDGLRYQSKTLAAYIDLDVPRVRMLFLDDAVGEELYSERWEDFKGCRSLMLPRPEDFDDYKVMCDFAAAQDGAVGERLTKAVEGRGAFKRFKNEISKLGLEHAWDDFRSEARAEFVRDFLESNGIRWI